jgi:hypothetical protein
MAESYSTTVAEAAKPSQVSSAPQVIQRSPESDHKSSGLIQRASTAINSGSPLTPPNKFGQMIDGLPDAASQASAFSQLQSSYGNSYAGQVIQRKCECGGKCDECNGKKPAVGEAEKKIQRQGGDAAAPVPDEANTAIARKSEGTPLDAETRSFMESRFKRDFSDVRVHTDTEAAEAARSIKAQAFTTGRDVYFGAGQYTPGSDAGRKLLAHELTHVVQQSSSAVAPGAAKLVISTPGDSLEQEADRAAESITTGRSPEILTLTPAAQIHRKEGDAEASPAVPAGGAVFEIPPEKGKDALPVYKSFLAERTVLNFQSGRENDPDEAGEPLFQTWLKKKGLTKEEMAFVDANRPQRAKGEKRCTVDHIVDWALGGSGDDANNLILMEGNRNSAAGGRAAAQYRNAKAFTAVRIANPQPDDVCMHVDKTLKAWVQTQMGGGADNQFVFEIGQSAVPITLPVGTPKDGGNLYENKKLELLLRSKREKEVTGGIELQTMQLLLNEQREVGGGSKLGARFLPNIVPFELLQKGGKDIDLTVAPATKGGFGVVGFDQTSVPLPAKFPYLSETTFDFKRNEQREIEGEAKLTPSKPLLNKTVIIIVVKNNKLSAKLQVPVKDLNLPVPGLTLGGDGLILGFEDREFFASGQITLQYGTVAKGELTASATKKGFTAAGKIELTIPGIDRATGKISIGPDGSLSGEIEVGADKLKVPGVKKANLTVTIKDGALSGEGIVQLAIPGVKEGRLHFGVDKNGDYSITGLAMLDVPGLKAAEIGLTYRNRDLEGLAKVGFDIPGLEGAGAAFEIRYAKGAITGVGDFTYKKGKLSGKVHAELNEKRKIFGGGELAYEIIPGLVAAVGIQLREDGTAKISGELRIPDKIDLFAEKAIEKTLFSFGTQIPILAIPLGTRSVGLVAEIGADLKARAGFGPGQIRQLKVKASFDPAQEESAFEFAGGGELYVPAFAELALGVHGGIGLSLAIASATGGIELIGALGLKGALSAMVDIAYKNNQFSVDSMAELSAQPVIRFEVNAYVKVEVSLIFTTIEVYRKDWKLASKEWGSGLKIGLRFPVHYVFGQPFELSLSQVEFIVPDIDAKKAVKDLLLG